MIKNVCTCERGARVVGGLFLASLAFWGPSSVWFLLLGLIPIVTGAIGYCPVKERIHKDGCSLSSCCCKRKDEKKE